MGSLDVPSCTTAGEAEVPRAQPRPLTSEASLCSEVFSPVPGDPSKTPSSASPPSLQPLAPRPSTLQGRAPGAMSAPNKPVLSSQPLVDQGQRPAGPVRVPSARMLQTGWDGRVEGAQWRREVFLTHLLRSSAAFCLTPWGADTAQPVCREPRKCAILR